MSKTTELQVTELKLNVHTISLCIVGTTPMLMHAMSAKAKRELLLPKTKTQADRQATLKHTPIEEFRDALYRRRYGDTALYILPGQIKEAMKTAALRTPRAKKTEIGQVVFVVENQIPVWGVPALHMSIVRQAGMNKTPDIRTRPILPTWCAQFSVQYLPTNLSASTIADLAAMAGIVAGIGDWRPEKGKGNFGSFRICGDDDPQFLAIRESGGFAEQEAAITNPLPYDAETAELLEWYDAEVLLRRDAQPAKKRKEKQQTAEVAN